MTTKKIQDQPVLAADMFPDVWERDTKFGKFVIAPWTLVVGAPIVMREMGSEKTVLSAQTQLMVKCDVHSEGESAATIWDKLNFNQQTKIFTEYMDWVNEFMEDHKDDDVDI